MAGAPPCPPFVVLTQTCLFLLCVSLLPDCLSFRLSRSPPPPTHTNPGRQRALSCTGSLTDASRHGCPPQASTCCTTLTCLACHPQQCWTCCDTRYGAIPVLCCAVCPVSSQQAASRITVCSSQQAAHFLCLSAALAFNRHHQTAAMLTKASAVRVTDICAPAVVCATRQMGCVGIDTAVVVAAAVVGVGVVLVAAAAAVLTRTCWFTVSSR